MRTIFLPKISYTPPKDEALLEFQPPRSEPNTQKGRFKLWWDKEGNIRAIAITSFTKEIEEFRKRLNIIKLGSIWKGVEITDEDIREAREELLRSLRKEPQSVNKEGVLVVQSEPTGEIIDAERREREARMSELMRRTGL